MLHTVLRYLTLLGLAGSAMSAADHWILTQVQTLAAARMDPIVNPGNVSSHVHNIMGGSAFSQSLGSPDDLTSGACSTTISGGDKSNYWAPHLYYRYENNTYAPMLGGARIYYYTKSEDVKPFPPGLRMISGLAMTRNASDTKSLGLLISCDHGLQTQYLPNATSHPGGCSAIAMGITFPSCGLASGNLTSDDFFSHMAWPLQSDGPYMVPTPNGPVCPDSHPIKANYYLRDGQPWRNEDNLLVLSTGDTTGLGYHADFHNGWDQQTLRDAITECGLGKGPGDQLTQCAPLAATMNVTAAWDCRYQGQIPDEDVGFYRPLDSLPGCNPLWTSDMPDVHSTCDPAPQPPAFVSPDAFFENLLYRQHIPIAFPQAENSSDTGDFIPGLGATGASKVLLWGSDGSDVNDVEVGTVEDIVAGLVGSQAASADEASSSSTSATSSTSKSSETTTSAIAGAADALAVKPSISASTSNQVTAAGSADPASTPKVCSSKKRNSVGKDVEAHVVRRSRRDFINH
ncbi:MAG: hypothetical protein TREMPRED_005378 [Tremellales sp. Tagirdzhanova-0007]|nr:MAG: hypothetical protein TREMPRED_005378 [Tremellales sp. Tagirdzhanova-0007]